MIAGCSLGLLLALFSTPHAVGPASHVDLDSAGRHLESGKLSEALEALEDVPPGAPRSLLEVRIQEAAGRYELASRLGLEAAGEFGAVDGETAMQLEFYAAKAALWDRRGTRALTAVEAMEARLDEAPLANWLEPYSEAWRQTTDDYRARAEELIDAQALLVQREQRARWTALAMGLAAGLALLGLGRGQGSTAPAAAGNAD